MMRYRVLLDTIKDTRPRRIIEVGTHNGDSAVAMCRIALRMTDQPVHYVGYDLFDDADEANHAAEKNGKGAGSYEQASQRLTMLSVQNGGRLTFELVRGNTRDTLHGKPQMADLAFIDGGHSVETIRGDYEALQGCPVVVCDDYYEDAATGCRFLVDDGWHITAPDENKGESVSMAIRGWKPHDQTEIADPEWRDAVAQLMAENKATTVVELDPDRPLRAADCVVGLTGWDTVPDVRQAMTASALFARKCGFFVFPLTAERGAAFYEAAVEGIWRVLDRVETPDAFMVSVAPYLEVPEITTKGAGPDEERLSNARANIKAVKHRVMLPVQAHGRRIALACYGPSLQHTWDGIARLAEEGADVVSTSAAHDFLIERGIVPDFHVDSDPRAHKAKHVNKINRETQYYFASCVHPVLVNKVAKRKGRVALWHSYEGEWSAPIGRDYDLKAFPGGAPMVLGGSNVGLRACMLFYALGYRRFDIFGMDCSFAEDGAQHAGAHAGKENNAQPFFCAGKRYMSSMLHAAYARQFMDMRRLLPDVHWRLYGDGLLQTMAAAVAADEQPVAQEAA